MKAGRRYLNPFEHTTGLIYDQMVVLAGYYSHMNFDTHHVVLNLYQAS